MSWAVGEDPNWKRWIGYGVPAYCDHPKCNAEIDRGLAYVCGGQEVYGGEHGCGLFFCDKHRSYYSDKRSSHCSRCGHYRAPFKPKPDHPKWIKHLLTDKSWAKWRAENPREVKKLRDGAA